MFRFATDLPESSDSDLERYDTLIEAQDALETVLRHVARTSFEYNDFLKLQLALSAIMGAFACVERARKMM